MIILVLFITACTSDRVENYPERDIVEEDLPADHEKAGEITIYNPNKMQPGYVLVNDASANRVYLMEKENSEIIFEWDLPAGIGNDAVILPDGNLLVALNAQEPYFEFGGYGGRMAIIDPDGNIIWDFEYSDEFNLSHHDLEMLPNGNILFIAWEKKDGEELIQSGYNMESDVLYVEKIIEIDPSDNSIVWSWNSWDHLVQDLDENLNNFANVSEHPELIDINYKDSLVEGNYGGDNMHANGIDYDPINDLIYLSVNYYSEIWVIDHSTSPVEASGGTGGNYGKGGDLVYRFGNPETYRNDVGERTFFHNHTPNVIPGTNRFLVFSNGIPSLDPHSIVYELELPEEFSLHSNTNNELNIAWSFQHEDLFSGKVSGAFRLPNGNTLITEGTSGVWEVTASGEIVWKFEGEGFFWRAYHYDFDSPGIINLGLNKD